MATWVPRIGTRAATQQYIAQWLVGIGGLAVIAWIIAAIGGLNAVSIWLEVASLALIAIGLVVFVVSRRNRVSS